MVNHQGSEAMMAKLTKDNKVVNEVIPDNVETTNSTKWKSSSHIKILYILYLLSLGEWNYKTVFRDFLTFFYFLLALHVGTVCYLFSNFQSNLPSYNVDDLLTKKIEDDDNDNWTHESDKQSRFTKNNYEIPWARVGKFPSYGDLYQEKDQNERRRRETDRARGRGSVEFVHPDLKQVNNLNFSLKG